MDARFKNFQLERKRECTTAEYLWHTTVYNDRTISLNEICDEEKSKYILDNNNFDEEVNNLAKNYYISLDTLGRKKVIYRQKNSCKNRYYAVGSALKYLNKEIRNSIIPKKCQRYWYGKLSSFNIIIFM